MTSGRSYGITFLSPGLRLSVDAEALINDFALSLADWSSRAGPEARFSAFFPLDERAGLHVLFSGAALGRGNRGSIAVARGLVLSRADLPAVNRFPYRLLASLGTPDGTPWEPPHVEPRPEALQGAMNVSPGLLPFFEALQPSLQPTLVVAQGGDGQENLAEQILSLARNHRFETPLTWTTAAALAPNGRFRPDRLNLVFGATDDLPAAWSGPRIHVSNGIAHGPALQPPPAWLGWRALFDPLHDIEAAGPSLPPVLGLSAAQWRTGYAAMDLARVVEDSILRLMRPDMAADELWRLFSGLAQRVEQLAEEADRVSAARGLIEAFRRVTPEERTAFLPFARRMLREIELPTAIDTIQSLIVEREALNGLEGDVAHLVRHGLGDAVAERMIQAVSAMEASPSFTAGLVDGLERAALDLRARISLPLVAVSLRKHAAIPRAKRRSAGAALLRALLEDPRFDRPETLLTLRTIRAAVRELVKADGPKQLFEAIANQLGAQRRAPFSLFESGSGAGGWRAVSGALALVAADNGGRHGELQ